MVIEKLEVRRFRNLHHMSMDLHPRFNVIYGANGSGKTSLIEAIYYLSRGRSFRSSTVNRIIQQDCPSFSITADVSLLPMSICRHIDGSSRLKIGGSSVNSIAEFCKLLPVQLINSDSYSLIKGTPKIRRQFIDWGVFHVEPSFFSIWKNMQRILKQRNLAIKRHHQTIEVKLWDKGLIDTATVVSDIRYRYINQLKSFLNQFESELVQLNSFLINYYAGWPREESYISVLERTLKQDLIYGHTRYGCHRADLVMTMNGVPLKDRLSQGEQKMLIYAMLFAQSNLLFSSKKMLCVCLIDDLSVELDQEKQRLLFLMLTKLNAQVFITAMDKKSLAFLIDNYPAKLFHVEHGQLISD